MGAKKNKPTFTAIIQARMDSSRLPGKAMLPLKGKPMLYHVIERARAIHEAGIIVLATCPGDENASMIELADSMKIGTFVGSSENVLERYYMAAEKFGGDYIIRITGDNPFTDPVYASVAAKIAEETKADLCSIKDLPLGVAVEIIKKEALEKAYTMSRMQHQLEHVSPYIKENPDMFKIVRHAVSLNNPFETLRLTVDTGEDYTLAKIIYDDLYKGFPIPLQSIIDFFIENPHLADINSGVHQRPMTHSSNG